MYRPLGRYLLIFFVVLVLFIFILVKIFSGHPAPAPTGPTIKPLPDYSSTFAQVSYTLDGPINGDDQHRAIRITIDQYQRTLDIIGGYNGNVIEEKTFNNNQNAYNVFLYAINNYGFLDKNTKAQITNQTGQCPLGDRLIFELNDGGNVLSHLWTTSCGGTLGTMAGNAAGLQQLFQNQITNYSQIISQANLQIGY